MKLKLFKNLQNFLNILNPFQAVIGIFILHDPNSDLNNFGVVYALNALLSILY